MAVLSVAEPPLLGVVTVTVMAYVPSTASALTVHTIVAVVPEKVTGWQVMSAA